VTISIKDISLNDEIKGFILDVFKDSKIRKITHSIEKDLGALQKIIKLSPKNIKNVVELTDNVFSEDKMTKNISMGEISESIFGKSLDLDLKQSDLRKKPMEDSAMNMSSLIAGMIYRVYTLSKSEAFKEYGEKEKVTFAYDKKEELLSKKQRKGSKEEINEDRGKRSADKGTRKGYIPGKVYEKK